MEVAEGQPPAGTMARSGFAARSATGKLEDEGTRFAGTVEATRFERVFFYDRPMFVESAATSRVASSTPNLPQIGGTVPDERRTVALRVQVIAPRVVRLRLGERADDGIGVLVGAGPPGLPLTLAEGVGGAGWVLAGGELTITVGREPFGLRIERED